MCVCAHDCAPPQNSKPSRSYDGRAKMKRQVAFAVLSLITSTAAVRGETWPYENWPMYGKDLSHTFSNPITQINRGNVGSLMPAWTFPTGDAVSASPAVVDGVVYVGSWGRILLCHRCHNWPASVEGPIGLPTVGRSCSPGLRGACAWNGDPEPLSDPRWNCHVVSGGCRWSCLLWRRPNAI